MLEIAAYTDKARRDHNEDAYLIDEDLDLFVVADGVGGLSAGEVASQIVCEEIRSQVSLGENLEKAINGAHTSIDEAVKRGDGKSGMASTVVAAQLSGQRWQLAWVGDSRIYVWDGELKQLSKDHSYVESLYDAGQITLEETDTHPRKNVITQAIGGNRDSIDVAHNALAIEAGQILLLCSDGLSGEVNGGQMIELLSSGNEATVIAKKLVRAAYDNGGKDNITCIVVRLPSTLEADNDIPAIATQVFRRYDQVLNRFVGANDSTKSAENVTITDGEPVSLDSHNENEDLDQTAIIRVAPKSPDNVNDTTSAKGDDSHIKPIYWLFFAAMIILLAVIIFLK